MKTLEEFVKEIGGSEALQKALGELRDKAALEAFLQKNGCSATADEFIALVRSQGEGELTDDGAGVTGGSGPKVDWPHSVILPFRVV